MPDKLLSPIGVETCLNTGTERICSLFPAGLRLDVLVGGKMFGVSFPTSLRGDAKALSEIVGELEDWVGEHFPNWKLPSPARDWMMANA